MSVTHEIMHMDRRVAAIDAQGGSVIDSPDFMPCNLYLEEADDLDTRVNNITNFQYWCATRVLTLDRTYAKALLNSAGLSQAVNDRDRAKIALTYRCLSLTDVFWVRMAGEKTTFAEVNLYQNHLDKTFIDIALRGRQYTVQNEYLARDLSTNGCFPKAWRRSADGFYLLKDGSPDVVERELLASQLARCFDADQVLYERDTFDGTPVTISRNMTSLQYSIVSYEALVIMLENRGIDPERYILALDRKNYHMMNIIDYLIGNPDRHWGNWGVLVENESNRPIRLHDLMDFNQAFTAYDTVEGANCQTVFGQRLTQKEAAERAVRVIGLNQIKAVAPDVFHALPQYRAQFEQRLAVLKQAALA